MPTPSNQHTEHGEDGLRLDLLARGLPSMLPVTRQVLGATEREEQESCLAALHRCTESELREIKQRILPEIVDAKITLKQLNTGVTITLPHYVDINRVDSETNTAPLRAVFLTQSVFELLRGVKSDLNKGVNGAMLFTIPALSKGEFSEKKIQFYQAGVFANGTVETLVDVAAALAAVSESPSNSYRQANPKTLWSLSKLFLGEKYPDELVFRTAVLGWCEFIERTSQYSKATPAVKSLIPREVLECFEAPANTAAANRSTIGMQKEYSQLFSGDEPPTQFNRLLASGALEDYVSVIKAGCPLAIPNAGQGLIRPLCWTERCKSQASRDDYLSAQLMWVSRQPCGIDTMFLARYHTLHRRDYPLKCPSMRVLRITPDCIADRYLEPRQYLIDRSRPGVDSAITTLRFEPYVVRDASGNRWISMNQLDAAARAFHQRQEQLQAVQTLLEATHFSYFNKKMV